jgi:hypothetical protein
MIDIDLPDNKSIIVFSSFRTRSTALCDWLARQKGLTNFDEAFIKVGRAMSFVNFVNRTPDKFMLKIMCNDDQYIPEIQHFMRPMLDRCTVIRLRRQDVFAQIKSFYIAATSDHWHFVKQKQGLHPFLPEDTFVQNIAIDSAQLRNAAISILTANQRLNTVNVKFDLELVSENLGVLPSNYQLIPPPTNLDRLNTALKTLIDTDVEVGNLYHNRQDFSHFGK